MVGLTKPVVSAALEAVQEIDEMYEGYRADLAERLSMALQFLDSGANERSQRRPLRTLSNALQLKSALSLENSYAIGKRPHH